MFVCEQLQNQLDEAKSNVSKESRVRERAEQYTKDLVLEMEQLKRRQLGRAESSGIAELTAEIAKYVLQFLMLVVTYSSP